MRPTAVALVLLAALPAAAQTTTATRLAEAQRRFAEGDYQGSISITSPLVGYAAQPKADLAEALRLHGLSLFLLGRHADAEVYLYEFLKLDPEAHLDPALVPPEAVAFLENIRSRHEGELRRLKPRPKRNRWLNFLPPWGQFENRQPVKGWLFGAAELVLAATTVSSFVYLTQKCDRDLTCSIDASTAENIRTINLVSGAAFVAVVGLGVLDGFLVFNRQTAAEPPPVSVVPSEGGASLVVTLGF